jgi:thiopeptide-type bacteriocin biosynthesis protein
LAARPWRAEHEWLQAGVHPPQDAMPSKELYERVATFVRGLLRTSVIDDFFFMHKPPGMRLRFRMRPTTRAALADVVASETTRWRENGLIDHVESAVYEPESLLFGGPQAMPFVHALFTVDSLLWLDYHASDLGDAAIRSPSWLVSLAVLRTVFAGLDITGWEDLGVWDCVRRAAGRQLGDAKASTPLYDEVAGQLRNVWSRREDLAGGLDPASQAIVARHEAALQTGAARWRSGYFLDPRASLGPRTAAAFYVVFHWNRAALTQAQQALLAESLAERMNADGHG